MRRQQLALITSGILWLLAVGVGTGIMWNHALSPGSSGNPPMQWPTDSQIQPVPGRATLVMLAHPHCPCTRASIGELALLMARIQGQVSAHVLLFKLTGFADDWEKTDLWRNAAAIPGVHIMGDTDGSEARRFQAATSGHTLLYDTEGRLLFSGGITSARGHSGDNVGRSAILTLLTRGGGRRSNSFVLGCPLLGEDSQDAQGVAHGANSNGLEPAPIDCATGRGSL